MAICISIIICFMIDSLWNLDEKSGKSKSGIESDISSKESKSGRGDDIKISEVNEMNQVKETAGGFYLYDKEKQPILNDQEIEIGADEKLELNIECVNACDVKLNYFVSILVNDCYQKVSYKNAQGVFSGKGKLQSNSSEMINLQFAVNSYNREKNNELRIIMFYYPDDIPKDELEQVLVGDSVGIYTIKNSIENKVQMKNGLNSMKVHSVNGEEDMQAIWLTEEECVGIPKFDYILDLKKQKCVYFNSVGGNKTYVGMVFVDGDPIKINNWCSFTWKQKKNSLLNYRIDEDVEGKTMFAYMYESCADREDTYVTNLYRLN